VHCALPGCACVHVDANKLPRACHVPGMVRAPGTISLILGLLRWSAMAAGHPSAITNSQPRPRSAAAQQGGAGTMLRRTLQACDYISCDPLSLGDGVCDSACSSAACNFDDCDCPGSCTPLGTPLPPASIPTPAAGGGGASSTGGGTSAGGTGTDSSGPLCTGNANAMDDYICLAGTLKPTSNTIRGANDATCCIQTNECPYPDRCLAGGKCMEGTTGIGCAYCAPGELFSKGFATARGAFHHV
jgi:hypothetical protein